MGQKLYRLASMYEADNWISRFQLHPKDSSFPDLMKLPPELGLKILSNVDAADLRRAREIWSDLANDEHLWRRLCMQTWRFCNAYSVPNSKRLPNFWSSLYNSLEAGTLFFNMQSTTETSSGLALLHALDIVSEDTEDIVQFITGTDLLRTRNVVTLFKHRPDVLDRYVELHDFTSKFLPVAMRSFFFLLSISTQRSNSFTARILDRFSTQYSRCNPEFDRETVLILCYSLVMLSNDRSNPNIKNKMSKREFIKNTLKALQGLPHDQVDSEYLGHCFDNVYLIGHVTPQRLD